MLLERYGLAAYAEKLRVIRESDEMERISRTLQSGDLAGQIFVRHLPMWISF